MTTPAGTPPAGTPPAGTPPAGTPPAGTPPAGTPPAGTPPQPAWHGYTAPEDVAWVTNKGWQAPADAVRSAREAEKLIGRDPSTLLVLPRADDPNGFLSVMDKLGRPADPTKYEFDVPKDAEKDNPYLSWARTTFHKLGVPAPMAKALIKEQDTFMAEQATQAEKAYKDSVENDKAALLKEWAGGHERMMGVSKMAANALGFTPEMVDALESSMGYAGVMKFFADLGSKMSEDTLHTGGDGAQRRFDGAALTLPEAQAQWNAMKMDPNEMAALKDRNHPGHKVAQEKQNRLFKVMYPG